MSGVTSGFRELLGRLMTFKVDWNPKRESDAAYDPGDDRTVADLAEANVASSLLRSHYLKPTAQPVPGEAWLEARRHVVALDIDYPAHLVESSTPGHYHLYLDVPGGVEHEVYMDLLDTLGKAGVIEPGYAEISRQRGHTDLRLPWVAKDQGDSVVAKAPLPAQPPIPVDFDDLF